VNGDGFGFGWYGDNPSGIPCVFTSIKPSWNDRNLLRLSEHIKSRCIFAHVRAASPKSLIVETNCHPFQFGKILFMHNGTIAHFAKIKKRLIDNLSEECYSLIQGTTDTEHAGALFVNYLPNSDPSASHSAEVLKIALLKTMKHLIRMTKEAKEVPQASSLNFAVTYGEVTIATRFRNSNEEDPPSLYYTKRLLYKCDCDIPTECQTQCRVSCSDSSLNPTKFKSVVISSEPLTKNEEEWALIPKNYMLTVNKNHKVVLEPIELEEEFFIFTNSNSQSDYPPSPRIPKLLSTSMKSLLPRVMKASNTVKELGGHDITIKLHRNREFLIGLVILLLFIISFQRSCT